MRIRKKTNGLNDMASDELDFIAGVSDALAHPVRLELFRYIMQKNKTMDLVCTKDLVGAFDYAQATISQHMKKLVQSGLVEIKKQDKFSYFYVNLGILMQYIDDVKRYSVV
ncbi:ArsR/SmtB family transcription factor [Aminicella lysinilytica]|uniref:DNA-binding transcriptional ArsR family regulator n=1 Tax=Aminicella lysinilytica TaxID=433323 RepID=A0A4R6QC71_9FIRM|nr:metalloregulator ArsR/SmtB family transcription factor [Aminicella lysinilytica]TDP58939.1 DNA-binding transcriptional ArsR family regulator [Aminicella lysinilytica]